MHNKPCYIDEHEVLLLNAGTSVQIRYIWQSCHLQIHLLKEFFPLDLKDPHHENIGSW